MRPEWDREPVERLKTQTSFITAVQQVKKQMMSKVDLKDRMELPKPDMRVAILDIQHELTVEGIERRKISILHRIHWRWIETPDSRPYCKALSLPRMDPHIYRWISHSWWRKCWSRSLFRYIFQQEWPAGRNGSNYDGEIKIISEALIKIKELQIPKTVILSDSKAAIQAIVSKEERDLESLECKRLLVRLHNRNHRNKHATLQWVPAHCNICGNDEADKLAKKGNKMKQYKKALSYNAVKSHVCTAVKSNIKKTWEKASKGKQWLEAVTK
jgi:ribonuclease HI